MRLFKHHCGNTDGCRPTGRCGRILNFAAHAVLGLAVVVVVALLFGWVVMTAWNVVIPATFNLPPLNFWQAVGLLVLGRVLVGRFHHRPSGNRRFGGHFRRPDAAVPPDGPSFSEWWWEEGETSFRAFQARRASTEKPPE